MLESNRSADLGPETEAGRAFCASLFVLSTPRDRHLCVKLIIAVLTLPQVAAR